MCDEERAGTPSASEVTRLLIDWSNGNDAALEELIPVIEADLRRLARRYLENESPGHTLQPTALVNEAFLRLIEWRSVKWQNRAHLFAVAAKMMRRILVNHALHRRRSKRGGAAIMVTLTDAIPAAIACTTDVVALDEALLKLSKFDDRKSRLVELRFFGGLSEEESAEVLNTSLRTVQREWNLARAWLFRELGG